jgi:DNA-binding beta-propeller fold protein YncE
MEMVHMILRKAAASLLPAVIRRIRPGTTATSTRATVLPRAPLSFLALLGAAALLTALGAAPAVALQQRPHRIVVAPALRGARDASVRSQVPVDPLWPRAPRLDAQRAFFGFGSALVGTTPVGHGPSLLAVNPATNTIYVANGENNNGPSAGGDTVSVINAAHCDAHDVSRCKGPWPTITVGNRRASDLPSGIAIDERTDTVYVTNVGANTVSVFNGATCNAQDTRGCRQRPREVPVGLGPLEIFADSANHTAYVANLGNGSGNSTTVSMINTASCNARHLSACPTTKRPTVNVRAVPLDIDVDQASHTVYVTTLGIGRQNGWAAFNADTCNAVVRSGCGKIGRLIGDPSGPNDGEVDLANDTLYTANFDNTISVFDLRHCNAADLRGCAKDRPGTVTFPFVGFDHDLYLAVDARLSSVYVSFQGDDSLVIVDTRTCDGRHLRGCAALNPPTIHTGADPEGTVLDAQTQTLYAANEVADDVSVINALRCNALTTSGCRHPAPAVAVPGSAFGLLATDQTVHTAYIPSGAHDVSMIDTSRCSARQNSGCAHAARQVAVGAYPVAVAVNRQTGTVYVANSGAGSAGTVSVIDPATCNATDSTGCASLATLQVPAGNPDDIAVNTATDTIYVATVATSGPNVVSVFNGAACNAADTLGCGQAPSALDVGTPGGGGLYIAVSQQTNTVYATNGVYRDPAGDSVYVINGASCDAVSTAGCGQTPATVTVGDDPGFLAVDPATDTIYVVNHVEGDYLGSVSVINGAICNGQDTSGCGQIPPAVEAGLGALGLAIDLRTQAVYVSNLQDTSVSVINGATCNRQDTSGCGRAPFLDAVGNYPFAIAVDPDAGTAYVANGDNTVSLIPLRR